MMYLRWMRHWYLWMRTFVRSTYPRMTYLFGYEKLRQAMVFRVWKIGGEVLRSDIRNNSLIVPKIIIKNLVPRNPSLMVRAHPTPRFTCITNSSFKILCVC